MDNSKKKNILLGVLIVGVLAMTIAFAALSTRLSLNGTANVAEAKWNIHFQNWEKLSIPTVTNAGNTHQNTAQAPEVNQLDMQDTNNVTKVSGINVTLNQPGDTAVYNFEIINEGTITAKLSNFDVSLTPSSNVIGHIVKCYESNQRRGTAVEVNSTLEPNQRAYCYLQVIYNEQSNSHTAGANQVYEQSAISANLTAQWTWVQDNVAQVSSTSDPTEGFDNFITNTQTSGGPTLPEGSKFWIQVRNEPFLKQLCAEFSKGTVCMVSDRNRRDSDFADSSQQIVYGYTLEKKTEMEHAGAICYVNAARIQCIEDDISCYVYNDGSVFCRDSQTNKECGISGTGGHGCD